MPASSDEDATLHGRFRPQPPKASPKESARKGFRHVSDRRRNGEIISSGSIHESGSDGLRRNHASSSSSKREENGHANSSKRHEENGYANGSCSTNNDGGNGSSNSRQGGYADGSKPLSGRDHHPSSRSTSSDNQALIALEAEIRVLSVENSSYRTRYEELSERLEKANSLNAHLEVKLKLETGESHQMKLLKASHDELLAQLEQAKTTVQELQQREAMLREDLHDQAKENAEKQKALNKKLNSMELVQQQVVMENSRLHTEIRKERTLRQNCEVHLRSYNNNNSGSNNNNNSSSGSVDNSSNGVRNSPRFARTSSDSFLSPDAFSRSRDKARSPLRTAGKPSSPLPVYPHHPPRDPPPRLEGVIHLENRGRTNQQTFDLFKPFDEPSLSPPRTSTPIRRSRKIRPSPVNDNRTPRRFRDSAQNLSSPFNHERDFDAVGHRSSGQLSPPFATNTNRASELALSRLEKRLLSLHQEQQDCEDERTKLDRARDTVMGRRRKVELDGILGRLKVEISNVKTAIRRLGLP